MYSQELLAKLSPVTVNGVKKIVVAANHDGTLGDNKVSIAKINDLTNVWSRIFDYTKYDDCNEMVYRL